MLVSLPLPIVSVSPDLAAPIAAALFMVAPEGVESASLMVCFCVFFIHTLTFYAEVRRDHHQATAFRIIY